MHSDEGGSAEAPVVSMAKPSTVEQFRYHVMDLWRRTLRRRSQKDRMTWERMTKIAAAWLPTPQILHPWPDDRFAVNHPRWEPSA